MRDEDLKNLPQSIQGWQVREFLESLGIKHKDVFEMRVGVRSVDVGVYASDEKGMRFVGEDGKSVAQHRIAIPVVGPWEKPAEATQACGSSSPEGDATCELPEAHYFCRSGDGSSWPYPGPRRDGRDADLTAPEGVQLCDAPVDVPDRGPACTLEAGHEGAHWSPLRPDAQDAPPCPAYLTLGPDLRSNCERAEGHADEHASHVGGVLQRW